MKKLLSCLVSVGVLASTMMSFVSSTSFAAVVSGGDDDSGSWGVKINPTLLRFYKQNPYI